MIRQALSAMCKHPELADSQICARTRPPHAPRASHRLHSASRARRDPALSFAELGRPIATSMPSAFVSLVHIIIETNFKLVNVKQPSVNLASALRLRFLACRCVIAIKSAFTFIKFIALFAYEPGDADPFPSSFRSICLFLPLTRVCIFCLSTQSKACD